MTTPSFTLPARRFVLCDACGRRVPSDRVTVVGRRIICSKCKKKERT